MKTPFVFAVIVIAVIVAVIICVKNYLYAQKREKEAELYTKEKLQKMSVKELYNLYTELTHIVVPNKNEPDSKKIPTSTKSYGCKTWGEARRLMDLVSGIHNSKLPKKPNNQSNPVFTDAEKEKLARINKLDAVMNAYNQAKNGDSKAMMFIGMAYDLDLKIPKKAFYWMNKATQSGNIQAQYFLGTYYADGYGVEKNKTKGIGLILTSASKGNKDAIDCCINKLKMTKEEMRNCGISI